MVNFKYIKIFRKNFISFAFIKYGEDMKLYAVLALASILHLGATFKGYEAQNNVGFLAKPGDPGFPYFYCNTIIESENVFGPIKENQKSFSGNCHFEVFEFRHRIAFTILLNYGRKLVEIFYKDYTEVYPGRIDIEYELTFPENFVAKEPIEIDFYGDNGGGDLIAAGEYKFKTLTEENFIRVEDYLETDLIKEGYCFQLGKSENIIEKFHFEFPKEGYFLDDRYYRLNLDFLYFRYEGFSLGEPVIRMVVNDVNNLFPYLPIDSYGKYIPFEIVDKEEKTYFRIKGPLYVEPNSLLMSLGPREGFIPSNYFYLPRSKAKEFDGYEFSLNILQVGLAHLNLTYQLKFEVGYLMLGDCIDSDYCVEGKVYD